MQATPLTKPHSGLGIASFVISLIAGFTLLLLFGFADIAQSQPGGLDEQSTAATVIGLLMLLTAIAQITALGLGIAALVQAGSNKLFGILGTVFASMALLLTLLIVLIGAVIEG